MSEYKHSNRLINEKSPYLLQHAHNPVDWYPWGDEAFEKAKSEGRPIFLSIGYSCCHWCHVMRSESFEDADVAKILNENYVAIKVDREERPDIDHVYMAICQALTGNGGWPLTIFMTPDKIPFYAGTYFPKLDNMGTPGLISLLGSIAGVWSENKNAIVESGARIIGDIAIKEKYSAALSETDIHEAYFQLLEDFDKVYGGFGQAPKFPSPHMLYFLLRYWYKTGDNTALQMVEKTLDSMYSGGIYDHIGYGFSRYSTDRKWLVPHFEKMLYDNALLAIAYIETYQATGKEKYAGIAREVFTYILRDMTSPEGGFYSAEDADSEGIEGKFYMWDKMEVEKILGASAAQIFCRDFNITSEGNFEGRNILNFIDKDALEVFDETGESEQDIKFTEKCIQKLYEYREKRVHPSKDDKILTGWNGLMTAALAIGGRVLKNTIYIEAAEKAVAFIYLKLFRDDGRLLARFRDGEAAYPAYLDDYAFLCWGLLELYEATFKPDYLDKAVKLNSSMLKLFWDDTEGGLFIYGNDSERLILRPKEIYDGAIPSGNSIAALNFIRLSRLTGDTSLEAKAGRILHAFSYNIKADPHRYTFSLISLLYNLAPAQEIIVVADKDNDDLQKWIYVIREGFRPFEVVMLYSEDTSELKRIVPSIAAYIPVNGKTTVYICRNQACQAPVTDVIALKALL